MSYDFEKVEYIKVHAMADEKRKLQKLYEKWAKDIEKEWSNKLEKTIPLKEKKTQMLALRKALKEQANTIAMQAERDIKASLYEISNKVVDYTYASLSNLGVSSKALRASFSNIAANVVENLVNGSIYGSSGSWNLSKAIWGDSQKTLSDLYSIVAGGVAQNKSIYEISKELSKFVNPKAAKLWNLKDKNGARIYPKKVDYSAQRLARTLSQHAYQQSVVQTVANDPTVIGIKWHANGSRVCDICRARNGHVFPKDNVPLDHPNGMCVMEPVYSKDADKTIKDWVNSPKGTYPNMDKWASELGYKLDSPNPSIPVSTLIRNEDNKKVAKQDYKNDKPFQSGEWVALERDEDALLDKMREEHTKYILNDEVINKAVKDYTGPNFYSDLNAWLRGDKAFDDLRYDRIEGYKDRIRTLKQDLDKAMEGSKVEKGIFLRRKGDFSEFQNVFDINDSLFDILNKPDVLKNLNTKLVGSEIKVNQFMSTSTKFGNFNGSAEYFIKVNDDVHGMYVTNISTYGKIEDEIVLNRGTRFKVRSVEKFSGHLRFYLETV